MRELDARWPLSRMLADEGALGTGIAEELRAVHSLPIVAAQKVNRYGYAKLLHDAVLEAQRTKPRDAVRLYVVEDECRPLIEESETLFWNEKQTEMTGARHCYDSTLYAFRFARSWASERPPKKDPPRGTPEGDRAWAERIKRKHAAEVERQRRGTWWKR